MVAHAPIPPDEDARIAALHGYRLLDTPPEESFDVFTRVATWLFDVPVSAINLVDREQTFFKSLVGFRPYRPARCTSICAHAVGAGDDLAVYEDLSVDPRFCDHPLVVLHGARFYASALLRSESGHALGTLCLVDMRTRSFPEESRERLLVLARGVGTALELRRQSLRLLEIASQDALTGLCSRRLFEERLDEALADAVSGAQYGLLYLDLDRFKSINDRHGHAGGDALLIEAGRRLTAAARAEDLVARLAGDEFVVLVKRRRGDGSIAAVAQRLADRLVAALAKPFDIGDRLVQIGGSVGIALCPEHAQDAASLLRCADRALYRAKENGRSQSYLYQPGSAQVSVWPPALDMAANVREQ